LQYDAFRDGVPDGGLRTPADVDLLIVFLLEKLDGLTKAQVLEAISAAGTANYLEAAQCAAKLVARGALHSEGEDDDAPLHLTQTGRAALAVLGDNLPRSVGEKTLRAALRYQTRRRNIEASSAEIEPVGDGYALSVSFGTLGETLFSLRLVAANEIQAQNMRSRFLTEPEAVYNAVVAALL
jgi:hypothetical protein